MNLRDISDRDLVPCLNETIRFVSQMINVPDFKFVEETQPEFLEQLGLERVKPDEFKSAQAIRLYLEIFEVTGFIHPMRDMLLYQLENVEPSEEEVPSYKRRSYSPINVIPDYFPLYKFTLFLIDRFDEFNQIICALVDSAESMKLVNKKMKDLTTIDSETICRVFSTMYGNKYTVDKIFLNTDAKDRQEIKK